MYSVSHTATKKKIDLSTIEFAVENKLQKTQASQKGGGESKIESRKQRGSEKELGYAAEIGNETD